MNKTEIKKKALEEKGGKCILCGYNKCYRALHFHHVNDFLKEIEISKCSTWTQAEKELEKCVLLCANCHFEAHSGMINPETLVYLGDLI
jgi:hypothetical protein